MRVSIRKDDPGYANGQRFRGCVVLLNGAEVRCCFTADEEQGTVIVALLDLHGRVQCDLHTHEVQTVEIKGRVEIIPTPEKAALFAEINGGLRGANGHRGVEGIKGPVCIAGYGWAALPPIPLQQCIDPNAEMQQRDAQGALDQAIKDLARVSTQTGRALKQLNDALRPREPGDGLDIVAPMDHRLGRFKA